MGARTKARLIGQQPIRSPLAIGHVSFGWCRGPFGAHGVGVKGIRFLEDAAAASNDSDMSAAKSSTTTTTTPEKAFIAPQSVRDALLRAGGQTSATSYSGGIGSILPTSGSVV